MRKEGKLTPPAAAVIDNRRKPKLNLPPPPKAMGEELISLVDADIGHDPNGPPLLKNINLEVRRGMKLLLRGMFSLTYIALLLFVIHLKQIHYH